MVYDSGLQNLNFSPCGSILFGDHPSNQTLRTVPLKLYLDDAIPVPQIDPERADDGQYSDPGGEMRDFFNKTSSEVTHDIRPLLKVTKSPCHTQQSSNKLTLATRNGVAELSIIRNHADGAVVRKRLSSTAEVDECLLYLPDRTHASTSVNILDDADREGGAPKSVRLLLTMNMQDSYIWGNPQNRQSGSIVERPLSSIQQYVLPARAARKYNIVSLEPLFSFLLDSTTQMLILPTTRPINVARYPACRLKGRRSS